MINICRYNILILIWLNKYNLGCVGFFYQVPIIREMYLIREIECALLLIDINSHLPTFLYVLQLRDIIIDGIFITSLFLE